MTLKLNERYPGRFNNPSVDYPQGSFKNRTSPTAKDGSYLEQDWANDKEAFFQSLLKTAGIDPNGFVDKVGSSQFFDALLKIQQASKSSFAIDVGVENAYICSFSPAISSRSEGQLLRFKVSTSNTGASTFNDGAGVVPIVGGAHLALQGGELVSGGDALVQWNSSIGSGSYVLLFCTGASEQVAPGTKSRHALQAGQFLGALSGNGYIKIPLLASGLLGTLIIQWGTVSLAASSGTNVTFPISYPSSSFFVVLSPNDSDTSANYRLSVSNLTLSGFRGVTTKSQTTSASYVSFGA